MSGITVVVILATVVAVAGLGLVAFVLFAGPSGRRRTDFQDLMNSGKRRDEHGNKIQVEIDDIKQLSGSSSSKKKGNEDLTTKLFRAGFYTDVARRRFVRCQMIMPFVTAGLGVYLSWAFLQSSLLVVAGLVLGAFVGFAGPLTWLERKIRAKEEETMYYLPLVIEQISIGVSSALDVGPCISHVVEMAYERDSHNPVTEMFVHVEKLIRSGMGLEEALEEVSTVHGMSEIKHAFMFLGQCAKHGGEISKQLQELADAVMSQRQIQVEGRITALPVKATGPLATVFAGFFCLLFAGIAVRLMDAFK